MICRVAGVAKWQTQGTGLGVRDLGGSPPRMKAKIDKHITFQVLVPRRSAGVAEW